MLEFGDSSSQPDRKFFIITRGGILAQVASGQPPKQPQRQVHFTYTFFFFFLMKERGERIDLVAEPQAKALHIFATRKSMSPQKQSKREGESVRKEPSDFGPHA